MRQVISGQRPLLEPSSPPRPFGILPRENVFIIFALSI